MNNHHPYPGVYSITHVASGRRYIGSARDISRRWYTHRHSLKAGMHASRYLQNAWNKYGEDAFEFECLERCLDEPTILAAREQSWIDRHSKKLFNARKVAEQFSGDWYRTEEAKPHVERCRQRMKAYRASIEPYDVTCATCGSTFQSRDPGRNGRYCSRKCQYQGLNYQRTCPRCGKDFATRNLRTRFCSRHCGALSNHATRLPDSVIEEIRRRLSAGEVQGHIAKSLGVSATAICRISRGIRYSEPTKLDIQPFDQAEQKSIQSGKPAEQPTPRFCTSCGQELKVTRKKNPSSICTRCRSKEQWKLRTRISPSDVVEICRRLASGEAATAIALEYQADPTTIGNIGRRESWSDVALPTDVEVPLNERYSIKKRFPSQSRRLTEFQIREIRERLANNEHQGNLAREFGISQQLLCHIKYGRVYKNH